MGFQSLVSTVESKQTGKSPLNSIKVLNFTVNHRSRVRVSKGFHPIE